eukprot:3728713-Pleurochrysis_carterae.AAC.1
MRGSWQWRIGLHSMPLDVKDLVWKHFGCRLTGCAFQLWLHGKLGSVRTSMSKASASRFIHHV